MNICSFSEKPHESLRAGRIAASTFCKSAAAFASAASLDVQSSPSAVAALLASSVFDDAAPMLGTDGKRAGLLLAGGGGVHCHSAVSEGTSDTAP
eukprot:2567950-Prymnesium_polylepis.1